ncbi:putative porin [Hymenobacter sp. AT01-02]|uniref:putative porin n=1 Tax=Hymenobacter sp. AT01-02 TaxID=1571877 RepID=UPI00128F9810|nr:putative porin [Hymenobacter sp. AT01-02]
MVPTFWLTRMYRQGLAVGATLLLLLGLLPNARAQVLDDSTKNRYGARTTFIIREADVLRQDTVGRMIDTTLTRLPQVRYWVHDSTFYQDLGNFGTAARPLLWQPNLELGARLGRNVFDRYTRNSATIPYYDTRSPYTFFRFNQGNPYEQVFELSYTRSLKKAFNVGFAYERFGANKALAVSNTRSSQVEHSNFLLFVRYQSPNDRYHMVANLNTSRHRAVEQGGIQPLASDTLENGRTDLSKLFEYQREVVNLTNALNRDDRDEFRLTHTYRLLGRGLTVYHTFDWRRQQNKYVDTKLESPGGTPLFYPQFLVSNVATDDRTTMRQVENTVGLMGRTAAVEYRLYGRQRYLTLTDQYRQGSTEGVEVTAFNIDTLQLFVGGTAAFSYRQFAIETAGELKPSAQLDQTEYWLRGAARLGPLVGELLLNSYSPTLTQQRFSGNHYAWDNTGATAFRNTNVQQLRVSISQQVGGQYLEASGTAARIGNLVYYNQYGVPAQADSTNNQQLFIAALRHRFHVGHFYFDNQATYTAGAGEDKALRIPALVAESRIYYQGYVFKRALFGQVGMQTYFQSRWKAYNYSPSTQQFYLQDYFTIRNTPLVDVFLSADIKTLSIFLKMAYINQFLPQSGYYTTPYYTGLPRRFQFGIRWQFFN